MLTNKLKEKEQIDSTGKLVYLIDDTGFWNGFGNFTGYGAPNPARSDVALFPYGLSVSSGGSEKPLTFSPSNPITASEWIAHVPQDAWLKFMLLQVPAVNIPLITDYEENQLVYSKSENALFVVFDTVTTTNIGNIFVRIDPKDLVSKYPSYLIKSAPYNMLFLANSSLTQINLNKRITELYISSESLSNVREIKRLTEEYNKTRAIIQASLYQFVIDNKYTATRFLEFLNTNNYVVE